MKSLRQTKLKKKKDGVSSILIIQLHLRLLDGFIRNLTFYCTCDYIIILRFYLSQKIKNGKQKKLTKNIILFYNFLSQIYTPIPDAYFI
jgi:hypothetical protein